LGAAPTGRVVPERGEMEAEGADFLKGPFREFEQGIAVPDVSTSPRLRGEVAEAPYDPGGILHRPREG